MLLDIDGLSEEWIAESNTDSNSTPFSIQRLNNPGTLGILVRMDISGIGYGNDCARSFGDNEEIAEASEPAVPDEDGYIFLSDLNRNEFRQRLMRNFNISFHGNEIKWPTRNK